MPLLSRRGSVTVPARSARTSSRQAGGASSGGSSSAWSMVDKEADWAGSTSRCLTFFSSCRVAVDAVVPKSTTTNSC